MDRDNVVKSLLIRPPYGPRQYSKVPAYKTTIWTDTMLFVGVRLDVYVKGERYGHFNGLIKNKMYEIDHEWHYNNASHIL